MRTVTVAAAKSRLSAMLAEVEAGEEIVITRRGLAVARIVPEPSAAPAGFDMAKLCGQIAAPLRAGDALHLAALTLSPGPSPASGRGEPASHLWGSISFDAALGQDVLGEPASHLWGSISPLPLAGEGPGEREYEVT